MKEIDFNKKNSYYMLFALHFVINLTKRYRYFSHIIYSYIGEMTTNISRGDPAWSPKIVRLFFLGKIKGRLVLGSHTGLPLPNRLEIVYH